MSYTQVVLTRLLPKDAYMTRSAWIPTKFAKVGKVIRLHDEPEEWIVTVAGKHPLDDKFVEARRDDYRYQRRVSDV